MGIYVNIKVYRQTFNETLQRWNVPKRKDVLQPTKYTKKRKHRWLAVDYASKLRGNGNKPYFNALRRIQTYTEGILDQLNRPVWKTLLTSKTYVHSANGWRYTVFTLTCQRIDYRDSIHGGMR